MEIGQHVNFSVNNISINKKQVAEIEEQNQQQKITKRYYFSQKQFNERPTEGNSWPEKMFRKISYLLYNSLPNVSLGLLN